MKLVLIVVWKVPAGQLLKSQSDYVLKVESLTLQSPSFVLGLAVQLETKKREFEFDVKQINSELEEISSKYRHMNNQTRGDGKVPFVFKKPLNPVLPKDHINIDYSNTINEIKSFAESYRHDFEQLYTKLSLKKDNFKKLSTKVFEDKLIELDERTHRTAASEASQIAKV